jgi:hypothetical protein
MTWRLRGWRRPENDDNAELDGLLAETWQAAAAATGELVGIQAGKAALLAATAQHAACPPGSTAPRAAGHTARRAGPRKRLTARTAAAASAVAALVAVAAAGAAGVFSTGNGQQIQTAAYVARVRDALASPAGSGLVGYARTVLPPGTVVVPSPGSWGVETGPGSRSGPARLAAAVMVTWTYLNDATITTFTASGQPVLAEEMSPTAVGRGATTVAVNYRDRTWWQATVTANPGVRTPAQPSCSADGFPGPQNPQSVIRQELSCGAYTEDGRQRVDGIDAIKLAGSRGLVLWIDPATYLPVRQVVPGAEPDQTDFRWYPAASASLANLKIAVPAGFRQAQPPARNSGR